MLYSEEPVRILAREVKELRNKCIALVKVLWHRHGVEEAIWELKEAMKVQYPNLFLVRFSGMKILLGGKVVTTHFLGCKNIGFGTTILTNELGSY
ncbi:receptor-like protein kinase [Gossypium australe]|uniref:Receptor-like protein kinase n=1 Tax=Gossypium australe TaxID=47621 RepID=A0A5B6V9P4_9ROSI|nr:receptor-like protein kinase [Gossypium australe]